ncbi:MAG: SPOR domain-containing protein [Hyphomonadaceae bacterium]|nr:SPOR domain-containing protein [Hyphomonadaceae bacterium]
MLRKALVAAMTRYSRSVIPGRPQEGGPADDGDGLDRVIFGSKKKPIMPPANDRDQDYPDPMDMDVDEAGFLVERSTKERRGPSGDRRAKADRRKQDTRRQADYKPLREGPVAHRGGDPGSRGPILLVGALVIVAVFGGVVWNAYREGVRTDAVEEAPQLAASGAFKTPPREVAPPVADSEPARILEQLEGGPSPVADTPPEVRAEPKIVAPPPVQAAAVAQAPPPSKFTAPPPAPLKQPAAAPAPQVVASKPAASAVSTATVASVPTASVDLPKPTAAATAPAPVAAFKPAFSPGGSWLVQVAAPSSEAGAMSEWEKRVKSLPEFFSAAERLIVQADVNGKLVYRLRAGAFASKADADAFCSAYKAKGGNCFPAVR